MNFSYEMTWWFFRKKSKIARGTLYAYRVPRVNLDFFLKNFYVISWERVIWNNKLLLIFWQKSQKIKICLGGPHPKICCIVRYSTFLETQKYLIYKKQKTCFWHFFFETSVCNSQPTSIVVISIFLIIWWLHRFAHSGGAVYFPMHT